jgi:hypothetical protein
MNCQKKFPFEVLSVDPAPSGHGMVRHQEWNFPSKPQSRKAVLLLDKNCNGGDCQVLACCLLRCYSLHDFGMMHRTPELTCIHC